MNNALYPYLKTAAIVAVLAWLIWSVYDFIRAKDPGDFAYHAGSNYFADRKYDQALAEYNQALRENAAHEPALRGKAETLIMLKRESEAIALYQDLLDRHPENAGYHANIGIAFDRIGEHRQALEHYRQAIALDQEVGDGPNWLTRFLRNQAEKPPGIAQRAAYLQAQFELPAGQRKLSDPQLDETQRPYKE